MDRVQSRCRPANCKVCLPIPSYGYILVLTPSYTRLIVGAALLQANGVAPVINPTPTTPSPFPPPRPPLIQRAPSPDVEIKNEDHQNEDNSSDEMRRLRVRASSLFRLCPEN
jgi:hypothetical protein